MPASRTTMLSQMKSRLSQSYPLSWLLHSARLRIEAAKPGVPLLIYQMGKVGSTAILDALHARAVHYPVYHVHFLAPAQIVDAKSRLKQLCPAGYNANSWCLLESERVRSQIDRQTAQSWNVITLVRDPVARTVSSFFYNAQKYMPDFYRELGAGRIDTAKLVAMFLNDFPEHDYTLNWFDKELKAVFGIDVYAESFPHSQGYCILHGSNVRVLVLKLEKLAAAGQGAMNEFLGVKGFSPSAANTADERDYKNVYKKFAAEAMLPKDYLDKMYGSRLARHFYLEDELSHFRTKWRGES